MCRYSQKTKQHSNYYTTCSLNSSQRVTPPLATTNNFSTSARAPSPTTPSDFYCVFGALCRPLPNDAEGNPQGAPFDNQGLLNLPLNIDVTILSDLSREESPYDFFLNTLKTHQENDPNKEVIAIASLQNISTKKEITLTFPPVEIGEELYICVYIVNYTYRDRRWWGTTYKAYFTGESDGSGTGYTPKSIRASGNYMIPTLVPRSLYS
ncbi:MAG: hypothetical protein IKI31_04760 [Treponema sp.]|nr:hypothetical protein [Treponema sp.]